MGKDELEKSFGHYTNVNLSLTCFLEGQSSLNSAKWWWGILFSGVLPLFMPHLIICEVVSPCVSKTTDGLIKRWRAGIRNLGGQNIKISKRTRREGNQGPVTQLAAEYDGKQDIQN